MILHFEIKQTDNKPYISNQRALLRCNAGVGRDKSHLITNPSIEYWAMRSIISERGCLICLSKLIPNSPYLDSKSNGLNLEIIL